MNHIVSGCKDCPMCNQYSGIDEATICQHPNSPNNNAIEYSYFDIIHGEGSPDWCPLKKENLTIVFDSKD